MTLPCKSSHASMYPLLTGKKGIALNRAQWSALTSAIPALSEQLESAQTENTGESSKGKKTDGEKATKEKTAKAKAKK